ARRRRRRWAILAVTMPAPVLDGITLRHRRLAGSKKAACVAAAMGWWAVTILGLHEALPKADEVLEHLAPYLMGAATVLLPTSLGLGLAAAVSFGVALGARRVPGRVSAGEAGLVLERSGATEVVPHELVAAAWHVPSTGEVVLRIAGGDVIRVAGVLDG